MIDETILDRCIKCGAVMDPVKRPCVEFENKREIRIAGVATDVKILVCMTCMMDIGFALYERRIKHEIRRPIDENIADPRLRMRVKLPRDGNFDLMQLFSTAKRKRC